MPCYDPRDSYSYIRQQAQEVTEEREDRIAQLEGMLCAILNVLEDECMLSETLQAASAGGDINIDLFWEQHQKEDKVRLKAELDKFSQHERKMLKEMLEKGI
jgi:hypothetical protein